MLDPSFIQAIRRSQRRDRVIYYSIGVCGFLLGISFFAAFVFGGDDFPPDKRPNLLIVGGIFCLCGLYPLIYARVGQRDIVKILEQSPQNIVWVYLRVNQGNSYAAAIKFYFIAFGLRNKKQVVIRLPLQTAEALIRQVYDLVPQATFGYTPELEAAFNRNPASLIRT